MATPDTMAEKEGVVDTPKESEEKSHKTRSRKKDLTTSEAT